MTQIDSFSGATGAEAARTILRVKAIRDVEILPLKVNSGNHYDPAKKVIFLSPEVYRESSVKAIGLAAHECGHALQHRDGFLPLRILLAMGPIARASAILLPIAGFVGIVLSLPKVILLTLGLFSVLVVFQLVAILVELDASSRALLICQEMGFIQPGREEDAMRVVLKQAALTYVSAPLIALWNLPRYFRSNPKSAAGPAHRERASGTLHP